MNNLAYANVMRCDWSTGQTQLTWMKSRHGIGQIVEVALLAHAAMLALYPASLEVVAVVAAVLPVVVQVGGRDQRRRCRRSSGRRHHPQILRARRRRPAVANPVQQGVLQSSFPGRQLRWWRRHRQGRKRSALLDGKRRRHVASRSGAVAAARVRHLVLQRRMLGNRRLPHHMHPIRLKRNFNISFNGKERKGQKHFESGSQSISRCWPGFSRNVSNFLLAGSNPEHQILHTLPGFHELINKFSVPYRNHNGTHANNDP